MPCRIVLVVIVLLLQHRLTRSIQRQGLGERKVGRVDRRGGDEREEEDVDDDLGVGHVGVELVQFEDGQVGEAVVLTVLDLDVEVVLQERDVVRVVSV